MVADVKPVYVIAAGLVAVALLYRAVSNPQGTGRAIGAGAVEVADGVIAGTVEGVGALVGIPPTNETECDRAIREGRTWDASFACPAKRFLAYAFS